MPPADAMSSSIRLPYDVLREIFGYVDDLETLHSLLLTNRDTHRLAKPKVWNQLYLTTNESVASVLAAILNNRSLGSLVKTIRLPDIDSPDNPPVGYDSDPSVGLTDGYALQVLQRCSLRGPPEDQSPPEDWSYTEARVAAIMALCPQLETVVLDTYPPRDFNTLALIFQDMNGPFATLNFPRINNWRILPDNLNDERFPVNTMLAFGSKRLDLIAYTDGRFNYADIDSGLPILEAEDVDDLRVEDEVFEFDAQGEEESDTDGGDAADQEMGIIGTDEYEAFRSFTINNCFQFGHMGARMTRLHWKITVPFMETRRPREIHEDQEYDLALVNHMADQIEEEMDGINNQAGLPPAINNNGAAGRAAPTLITPSASFARSWWRRLEHFETTTGSVYGHPYVLVNNGYVTKAVPSYIEVLVLEERWHRRFRPATEFLALYRTSLCRDLKLIARGVALPRLRRVVFIPDQKAGYWIGLPERLEWTRDPNNDDESSNPFSELEAVVEANGDQEAAPGQREQFDSWYQPLNYAF